MMMAMIIISDTHHNMPPQPPTPTRPLDSHVPAGVLSPSHPQNACVSTPQLGLDPLACTDPLTNPHTACQMHEVHANDTPCRRIAPSPPPLTLAPLLPLVRVPPPVHPLPYNDALGNNKTRAAYSETCSHGGLPAPEPQPGPLRRVHLHRNNRLEVPPQGIGRSVPHAGAGRTASESVISALTPRPIGVTLRLPQRALAHTASSRHMPIHSRSIVAGATNGGLAAGRAGGSAAAAAAQRTNSTLQRSGTVSPWGGPRRRPRTSSVLRGTCSRLAAIAIRSSSPPRDSRPHWSRPENPMELERPNEGTGCGSGLRRDWRPGGAALIGRASDLGVGSAGGGVRPPRPASNAPRPGVCCVMCMLPGAAWHCSVVPCMCR